MGRHIANPPSSTEDEWAALVVAFDEDQDQLGREITRATRALASYADIEALDESVRVGLQGVMPTIAGRRASRREDLAGYQDLARTQADVGVHLDDVLHGLFIGYDTMRTWVRAQPETRVPAAAVGEFSDLLHSWLGQCIDLFTEAFREARRRALQHEESERCAFVRRLLLGEAPPADLQAGTRAYGLLADGAYVALRAQAPTPAAFEQLAGWAGAAASGPDAVCLLAHVDDEAWGVVTELPGAPVAAAVGVAPAAALADLPTAFAQATRALRTAAGLGLAGVHDVHTLGPRLAVLHDGHVTDALARRYIAPVQASGASADQVLETVRCFLQTQGNAERTSRELAVHPNTVRYRIRRFEELTGARLRDTTDFVGVWWALEWRAIVAPPTAAPAADSRATPSPVGLSAHVAA